MRAETAGLIQCFFAYKFAEPHEMIRIGRTLEAEILADHDAVSVAEFIDEVARVAEAAAPQADHVEMRILCRRQQFFVQFVLCAGINAVRVDEDHPFAVDLFPVDEERVLPLPVLCFRSIQLHGADTGRDRLFIPCAAFVYGRYGRRIERVLSVSVRPPELRIRKSKRKIEVVIPDLQENVFCFRMDDLSADRERIRHRAVRAVVLPAVDRGLRKDLRAFLRQRQRLETDVPDHDLVHKIDPHVPRDRAGRKARRHIPAVFVLRLPEHDAFFLAAARTPASPFAGNEIPDRLQFLHIDRLQSAGEPDKKSVFPFLKIRQHVFSERVKGARMMAEKSAVQENVGMDIQDLDKQFRSGMRKIGRLHGKRLFKPP